MLDNDVVHKMLSRVEQDSYMLSPDDQQRVIAYKISLETGSGLGAAAITDIQRIYRIVISERAPVLDASLEGALSVRKVLQDLATADKMLSAQERQFYNAIAAKTNSRQVLTTQEVEALLRLYAKKGF